MEASEAHVEKCMPGSDMKCTYCVYVFFLKRFVKECELCMKMLAVIFEFSYVLLTL